MTSGQPRDPKMGVEVMGKRLITSGILLGLFMVIVILFGQGCRKTIAPGPPAKAPKVIRTKSGIEMVRIPGGWFSMGSDRGDPDEAPVHEVWIDPFLMDRYELTQEEYAKFVIGNPSRFKAPKHPVEQVRWSEAILYCNARSLDEGFQPCYDEETGRCDFEADGYRLPTEAEWEYACRAGTDTDYSFGSGSRSLEICVWHKENGNEKTHPVGQKRPNPWGLFDMHGNVGEWCNDRYDENYYKNSPQKNPRGPADGGKYVVRGGAWKSSAHSCRSAYRASEVPGSFADACFARPDIGFRCVRNLKEDRKPELTAGRP